VDGAIHRAAGPELLAACRLLGGCQDRHAKLTNAYRLPPRFVIHTVGPVWQGGWHNEAELLADCYRSCLPSPREHNLCNSLSAVSCGVYGYPIAQAVEIALRETQAELGNNEIIERITFACFGDDVWLTYSKRAEANSRAELSGWYIAHETLGREDRSPQLAHSLEV